MEEKYNFTFSLSSSFIAFNGPNHTMSFQRLSQQIMVKSQNRCERYWIYSNRSDELEYTKIIIENGLIEKWMFCTKSLDDLYCVLCSDRGVLENYIQRMWNNWKSWYTKSHKNIGVLFANIFSLTLMKSVGFLVEQQLTDIVL